MRSTRLILMSKLNRPVYGRKKKFYLGFQHIQMCLFSSLGLFTIHQSNALQCLQFKDLQISLQKDLCGGPLVYLVSRLTG